MLEPVGRQGVSFQTRVEQGQECTEGEAHCCPKQPTPGDLFNGWKSDDGMSVGRDHGHNVSGQTEDGPPSNKGVLNVVDTLEQTPWHTTW
jgi:hypothetical protein